MARARYRQTRAEAAPAAPAGLQALLRQARAHVAASAASAVEPVRVLHHLGCTGGTLIAKCVAALPNVQLLSEVDPLSTLPLGAGGATFRPSDMIGLLKQTSRGTDEATVTRLFREAMQTIHESMTARGQYLVVRDHAHGHFCVGPAVPERPGLRQLLPPDLPCLPVVTVRHPLDSFASLARNRWLHFSPPTLAEYAGRYTAFLDHLKGTPIVRYEDFIADPQTVMQRLCRLLALPMRADFVDLFGLFDVSGDSGRSGGRIEPRPRRTEAEQLVPQAAALPAWHALCERLGYAPA